MTDTFQFVACQSCAWSGHETQLIAQACPKCDGRVTESATPYLPESLERTTMALYLCVADFMLQIQQAEEWGDLALVLAELEKGILAIQAVQGAGLDKERRLACP